MQIKAINNMSKIKKSWILEFWPFKIMKSGFYYTKNEAEKSIKILKIWFKYIFTINSPKIAMSITVFFYDFPIISHTNCATLEFACCWKDVISKHRRTMMKVFWGDREQNGGFWRSVMGVEDFGDPESGKLLQWGKGGKII